MRIRSREKRRYVGKQKPKTVDPNDESDTHLTSTLLVCLIYIYIYIYIYFYIRQPIYVNIYLEA
uniref:Uncharacterized protein n=1 Tax=Cannabis sativa TaxID=3483 RepID=A0A803R010_CANSA